MFVILGNLILSVILTIIALAAVILGFYWFLLIMTILTGLIGMQVTKHKYGKCRTVY